MLEFSSFLLSLEPMFSTMFKQMRRALLNTEAFVKSLRKFRLINGLSQTDLAAKLHVRPQAISNWENRHARPAPDKYPLLAALLKLSPESLVDLLDDDAPVAAG